MFGLYFSIVAFLLFIAVILVFVFEEHVDSEAIGPMFIACLIWPVTLFVGLAAIIGISIKKHLIKANEDDSGN